MERKSSQSKIDYNNKYTKENYTQIMFRVKKDNADKLKEYVKSKGISLNSYSTQLREEDMNKQEQGR